VTATIHLYSKWLLAALCQLARRRPCLQYANPHVDAPAKKPGWNITEKISPSARMARLVAMSNNAWKLKLPQDEWGLFYATSRFRRQGIFAGPDLNLKPSEGFSLAPMAGAASRVFPFPTNLPQALARQRRKLHSQRRA